MTYKQIEASRERRLWLGQIIIPVVTVLVAIPEVREAAVTKAKNVKRFVKEKFSKK